MDRARSRSPHRDEEAPEEQYNWDLHSYLTRDLKITASEDVIKETVKMLIENQIETPGELTVVPDEEVANMFPWVFHKKRYVVVMQAKKLQAQWERQDSYPSSSSWEVAQALQSMSAACSKASRGRRIPDSDEEAELDQEFNCEWALAGYHFPNFPHDHLMKMDKMERVAKKGATSFEKRGKFAPPGTILDYAPEWM